jgi:hypothetical protein
MAARRVAVSVPQFAALKSGTTQSLVAPAPELVEDLLADRAMAANVKNLYLGGDLSDVRLARLGQLPNLRCLVLLGAEDHERFWTGLRGQPTIEELTVDRTRLASQEVQCIGSLTRLKSLCFSVRGLSPKHLAGIRDHTSIEKLYLMDVPSDETLFPLLRSLPHLREVTLRFQDCREIGYLEAALRRALPRCTCRTLGPDR